MGVLYLTIDKAPINPSDKYKLVAIVWVMSKIAAGIIRVTKKPFLLLKNGYFVECARRTKILKTIAIIAFSKVGSLIELTIATKGSVVNNFQNLISCVTTKSRLIVLSKLYHF